MMKLEHLTFLGSNVEPASVAFGPRLNIIRGPSDTGKSFILSAIDFTLGAGTLKDIPQTAGYSRILLGVKTSDGSAMTLSRSVDGGTVSVFDGEHTTWPDADPSQILGAKHNAKSVENISRYLLADMNLDGKLVRKNARNQTDSLSFRNLAHLCIIDETKMQSEIPPVYHGGYTTRTKEVSVFKLLLQDEDDSDLIPESNSSDSARLREAQLEFLDRLIDRTQRRLFDTASRDELLDQLNLLTASINDQIDTVEGLLSEREEISRRSVYLQQAATTILGQFEETRSLTARFSLLLSQYESDIRRLEMIREAGSLLGYFTPGVCPYCGAEVAYQEANHVHLDASSTAFAQSVQNETQSTIALHAELLETLEDLRSRQDNLSAQRRNVNSEREELQQRLTRLSELLLPARSDIAQLVKIKSGIEAELGIHEQLREYERDRSALQGNEDKPEKDTSRRLLSLGALREFSANMRVRLESWKYPDWSSVYYDRGTQDVYADDQARSAHGKGVRSILHAAFTVGLADYCFERDYPHPGFVILDSPLVTYRPPDVASASSVTNMTNDSTVPPEIVSNFYNNLGGSFSAQIIVIENSDPPFRLPNDTVDIVFTKSRNVGRYGFFPVESQ